MNKRIGTLFIILGLMLALVGCTEESMFNAENIALDITDKVMKEALDGAKEVYQSTKDELNKQLDREGEKENNTSDIEKHQKGIVTRVVDGDTLIVKIDGVEERVRLIGVNTPESVGKYKDNPQPFGKEASNFTKSQLEGKTVYLQSDVGDRDKYNRLLRYVWISKPNKLMIREKMFNAILVKEGFANTMSIPPNITYQDLFLELEREAKDSNKGLWNLN